MKRKMSSKRTGQPIQILILALIFVLSAGTALAGPRSKRKSRRPAPRSDVEVAQVINLNTADPAQLQLLPGIGPSKAQAIVAYRVRRKFVSTFQIIRIKGIGRKTYLKLRPYLRVKGATTLSKKLKLKKKK